MLDVYEDNGISERKVFGGCRERRGVNGIMASSLFSCHCLSKRTPYDMEGLKATDGYYWLMIRYFYHVCFITTQPRITRPRRT